MENHSWPLSQSDRAGGHSFCSNCRTRGARQKRPAQQGDTRLIRVWAASAITPFEKGVVNSQNFLYNTHNHVYLRGVRRENRELRAELNQMKLEQVRLREDAKMARRIKNLLAFKEQHIDTTVAAQVIGTSGSDQTRVLYIDKGSSDGIRPDMAVITPNGIVGKIVQVFPDSAQVLPVNDQLSGVGVMLQNTRSAGHFARRRQWHDHGAIRHGR